MLGVLTTIEQSVRKSPLEDAQIAFITIIRHCTAATRVRCLTCQLQRLDVEAARSTSQAEAVDFILSQALRVTRQETLRTADTVDDELGEYNVRRRVEGRVFRKTKSKDAAREKHCWRTPIVVAPE